MAVLAASMLAGDGLPGGLREAEAGASDLRILFPWDKEDGCKRLCRNTLKVGGAFRVNYQKRDWGRYYRDTGEFSFETARVNLDLDAGRVIGSLDFRYYRTKHAAGHQYALLRYGWLGYRWDGWEVQAGVTQVPFGILAFASHSWFFQLPYYVGLEDDNDLGVKVIRTCGPWQFHAAYFLRDEGSYFGDSDDSTRYSYDLVREGTQGNTERHQLNLRAAYEWTHCEGYSTELGLSLQGGLVPNRNTDRTGTQWAAAAHMSGHYGRWNVMLQALRYEYEVKNDAVLDASPDGSFVTMGAYDAAYNVASKATIVSAGVSYTVPVCWGPIESLTFYNDYSAMLKDRSDFQNSYQDVLGVSVTAGKFLIYVDLGMGNNHPWLGPNWTDGLASGGPERGWNMRFNINIGYYF